MEAGSFLPRSLSQRCATATLTEKPMHCIFHRSLTLLGRIFGLPTEPDDEQ